ncbi:MAG: Transcriptional repressor nrdR [uncultured bacterium]|nr:MAG: Transcriptional repressor nrdR [uncultured bacterium]HBD05490.1 transcriptional regulator NrdR [Candidatus Uhrbacteria bacterium]
MNCPVCNCRDTKVVDSRLAADSLSIRRRRECEKCGFRFSTLEEVELLDLTVVKRDGRREAYSRDKLIKGIQHSLEKRPYTEPEFRKLIHKIERDIQKKKIGELTSQEIGEIVMNRLKTFDKVAYIRFASVYRSFEDIESFQKELTSLVRRKKRAN